MTILLIDDEPSWLEAVSTVLRKESYKVITANGGDEALAQLERRKPDLIVSDLRMPAMSGFDFFEKVKEHPQLKSIPFVFMSSIDDYDARRIAKDLGADDYIEKPYDAKDVKSTISDLLNRFDIR